MKKLFLLIGAGFLFPLFGANTEARMPPPADMPAELRDREPHRPEASKYYLAELVKEGKMTQAEADSTQTYMIFRHVRRQLDLKEAEGLDKEARRALMAKKRKERGNPLEEYAKACDLTLERAKELMDIMHDSDKGTKYYQKAKQ